MKSGAHRYYEGFGFGFADDDEGRDWSLELEEKDLAMISTTSLLEVSPNALKDFGGRSVGSWREQAL